MIPAEAVEATAKVVYRTSGRKRVMSYEQARPACEDDARYILEAAAPYMLAAAWEAAVVEGEASGWLHDFAADDMHKRNPYRPTIK